MQNRKRYTAGLQLAVLGLSVLVNSTVLADDKIVIRPSIATGVSYESNYFLTPIDEREVTIYHLRPGIELGYTTAKSNLLFDYMLDANWYDESGLPPTGELSADELDFVGHDLEFSADTQATDRLDLALENTYILSRDPDQLDYYANEITRRKYAKNVIDPYFNYQFGEKFNVLAGYRNTWIDYEDDDGEDSSENRGLVELRYNLNSLNSLRIGYQYWEKDYDENIRNYTAHQSLIGFSRELKYYTINLDGGYQHRDFEDPIQDKIDEFVWSASVAGSRPEFLVKLSQNINDTSIDSDYYLATRLQAEIGHLFAQKIQTKLQGFYQYSDYQQHPEDRNDDTAGISLNITYLRNEIFSIGLDTGYETRDSSLSENDYDNFYALAGVKINYDFGSR